MKNIICIMLLSVLSLSALAGPRVIGGGGGTSRAEKIDIQSLSKMVGAARAQLLMFFNTLDGRGYSTSADPYSKLSRGVKGLSKALIDNKVIKNIDGPCLDKAGKAVDGSIYPVGESSGICISIFNLSKKLTKENANIQLLGLMAHEYAHLAGADEALAEEIQRDVIKYNLTATAQSADYLMSAISGASAEVADSARKYFEYLKTGDLKGLCVLAHFMERDFLQLKLYHTEGYLSVVDNETAMLIDTIFWHLNSLQVGTCIYAKSPDSFAGQWSVIAPKYDQLFYRGPVTATEYVAVMQPIGIPDSFESGFLISKITSVDDMEREILRFLDVLRVINKKSWGLILRIQNN